LTVTCCTLMVCSPADVERSMAFRSSATVRDHRNRSELYYEEQRELGRCCLLRWFS
jgi:hypothetical protein